MSARIAFALALSMFLTATQVHAQANTWTVGPLIGAPGGANGPIHASIMWDPDGEGFEEPWLVVGGDFTSIEGVAANRIAMRSPYTGQWQPLGAGPAGPSQEVACLMAYNGALYAGGKYFVSRWDGSTWQAVGTSFSSHVMCLTVYNGDIIAGGWFSAVAGSPFNFIARWNGSSWNDMGAGFTQPVLSLGYYNGELIAGGQFSTAGGQPTGGIAAWNGSSWHAIGGGIGPNGTGVFSLTLYNGELVAGGGFSQAGGSSISKIARWNGSTWQAMGTISGGANDGVHVLTNNAGDLVAGVSTFVSAGVWDGLLSRWNGSSWVSLGVTDDEIGSLTRLNGEWVVGGMFTVAGGQAASHLARYTEVEWIEFGGGTVDEVSALINFRSRIVGAGSFQQPVGPKSNIAGFNGLSLSSFGTGTNGPVMALETISYSGQLANHELIAGGQFTLAGGIGANHIARWVESPFIGFPPAWAAMGAGFNSTVYAIKRHNGVTYAAGSFTSTNGAARYHIARWNESTDVWEAMGTGTNGTVYALESFGGNLYVGGSFTTAGGVSTGGLARWDGTSWSRVGGIAFTGTVYALEVQYNIYLRVGGQFSVIAGSPNIASYDDISSTFSTVSGGTNGAVRSLLSDGGALYVGGDFTTVGGSIAASRVATWDGAWHALAGGADQSVRAIALFHDEVHVGGTFTTVSNGQVSSKGWARYLRTGLPWLVTQPSGQSVASGATVSFTSQPAMGYPGITQQWYRFGVPIENHAASQAPALDAAQSTITGAHSSTLTIQNVSAADAGPYNFVVSNASGSVSSATVSLTVDGVTDVPASGPIAATVFESLGPNPSTGPAQLAFTLTHDAAVSVRVHDLAGRRVASMEGGRLTAGPHRLNWDGRGNEGLPVRSGLFFVTLEVDGRRVGARRLVIQR